MTTAIDVPTTQIVSNHGLLIFAGTKFIGVVAAWSHTHNQTVTPAYVFGDQVVGINDVKPARGEPVENMPGNATGMSINIERYDIYTERFEDAFGTKRLDMLTMQNSPLTFKEVIKGPGQRFDLIGQFYGVHFTSLGYQHRADDTRQVRVQASAAFTRRRIRSPQVASVT